MIEGYKILEYNDLHNDIEYLHKHGWDSGMYVGFPQFKDHYNMLAGSTTEWIGYPQSGKSELLLETLFNVTAFYGWKHLLQVPDIGKSIEVMAKLIHKYTGMTFQKKYPNYIKLEKAFDACTHLCDSFKILHKEDPKAKVTPIQFWQAAAKYKKDNVLHTASIDSWKDMYHDYGKHKGSYAQYLSEVLPIRNSIAEESGLHFHTVVHPKNPVRDKNRKVYAPYPDDMEGGAQWNNSGKCIIAVHRENLSDNVTDIFFRKIKPESVGRPTSSPVCLQFDVAKSRYYFLRDYNNAYAEKEYQEYTPAIVRNIGFDSVGQEDIFSDDKPF